LPRGRSGGLDQLIGAYIFLDSEASSFANGGVLYADGGITAALRAALAPQIGIGLPCCADWLDCPRG